MLGFPLGGALAPGTMRETSLNSTTKSARSGNTCEDAQPICCTDRDRDISENVLNDANSLNYPGQAPDQGNDVTMAGPQNEVEDDDHGLMPPCKSFEPAPPYKSLDPAPLHMSSDLDPPSKNLNLPPPHKSSVLTDIQTPMNIEPLPNQESQMDESPSAECISSPTGDVESNAEGDNNNISPHVNSDPDISPRPISPRELVKRAHGNPKTWRSVLRSEEVRTSTLDPMTPPFVPRCFPVDKPSQDGFNLIDLDRQHISLDNWGWWQNCLRLSGALHDGQPISLPEPEFDSILRRGLNRIKYSPSPGQQRLAKKQARAAKWQMNKRHKELTNTTRRSMQ